MSSSKEIFNAFFEFKGSGKILFDDDLSADVSFYIKMLQNGKTIGELDFITFHPFIKGYFSQMKKFILNGKLNELNVNIMAEKCYLTSISPREEFAGSKMIRNMSKGKFRADSVLLFPEALDKKPDKDLIIHFGIINIPKITSKLEVGTKLGKLQLYNYHGIDELVTIIRTYNIPLITSAIDIFCTPNGFQTVMTIVNDSIDIVQDFLKVTSLSQLAWHEWAFVKICEKIGNKEEWKLIFCN